ncbi:hypothetical protein BDW59DRAFT_181186, partial [Aspergillus cavernicola]
GVFHNQASLEELDDIAVIGLGCRLPGGASDPQKFWELLSSKRSALCTVPESRYNAKAFHHEAREKLNTLSANKGHFLEQDVAAFDAPFFNITSQEATAMDPTARMLLEVTYEAMESAGLPIESLTGSDTSCFVGCFTRDYHEMLMRDAETAPMYAGTGTGFSLLSNRVSWFYDLRGPSMTLDTACSSSLVGLHLACQGLQNGESKIAVVSGANLILSPDLGMWLSNLRMTSTDGLSRSFAEAVTGYGRGEGVATLILKPVRDALRDGDPIRAVIRGSGVNQDGHTTGITVPNSEAQADLIKTTYRSAALDVSQTSYFEAHGTGTAVGDPLELGAVAKAISADRAHDDPLYVGSVKSNIGHLEGAAGLAGVIKCILMLERGKILPNIHFDRPSKRIPFEKWRILVPTEVIPWPEARLQRASVNSFGYGGTNAHVILDSAAQFLGATSRLMTMSHSLLSISEPRIFIFSAPGESSLRRMISRMGDFLGEIEGSEEAVYLDQLAFTLSERRSKFPWKGVVLASNLGELKQRLKPTPPVVHTLKAPRVVFVFTGQGAQWARMGIELCVYQAFHQSLQDADAYLRLELRSEWSALAELKKHEVHSRINTAELSQPLCTIVQIALVELLSSWNVTPVAVVGHSSGEIAAAYCSGALSRQDAWTVAYFRGKVCAELNSDPEYVKGAMMAVGLSAESALEYVKEVKAGTVAVACVNSPSSVTVSGDAAGIDELQDMLAKAGVFCRKLKVEHAYHSHHMQRAAKGYLDLVSTIDTQRACCDNAIEMISSVSGTTASAREVGAAYWVQNLVSPVRFSDAVATLLQGSAKRRRQPRPGEAAVDILLEIGPHGALKGPLRQILQHHNISAVTYLSVLQRGEDGVLSAARAAGDLYAHGVPVNVSNVNRIAARPLPLTDLPSYPWDHSLRYWAESRLSRNYRFRDFGRHDLLGAPAADASAKHPCWRNILRVQEQPWLRDHVVHSKILFPASGSIVMVLEAVQQLVHREIESVKLEDVSITKAIVIPETQEGIEVILQLRKDSMSVGTRSDSWEFTIESCSDGQMLELNSSGRVTARYVGETKKPYQKGKDIMWTKAADGYRTAVKHCTRRINATAFYKSALEAGLQYGPLFQGLTDIAAGCDQGVATLKITDTKSSMPGGIQSAHLIHPTTLDVIFHSMFTALGNGALEFENASIPIGFDSITIYPGISSEANAQLRSCCQIKHDSRDIVADIYVSDMSWKKPKIVVNKIRCRELPGISGGQSSQDATKAPVGTLLWKPDIYQMDEGRLQAYVMHRLNDTCESGQEYEVGIVVDLAAHKNPELRILQIGHSDTLTQALLSVLGDGPGNTTVRCSKYTVLDRESDVMQLYTEKYSRSAGIVTFKTLDFAALEDNSIDIVVVQSNALSGRELQQLGASIRRDGMLVLENQAPNDSLLPTNDTISCQSRELPGNWSLLNPSPTRSWSLARKQHITVASTPIIIIQPRDPTSKVQEITNELCLQLTAIGLFSRVIQWPTDLHATQGSTLISLLELQSPFLPAVSSIDYVLLKTLLLNSGRALWVAAGNDPSMQAAVGYLRVLQNENMNLNLQYLLLEERPDRAVTDVAQIMASVISAPPTDREYIEANRCLHINRWMNDDNLGRIMMGDEDESEPDSVYLANVERPLKLLYSPAQGTKPQTVYGEVEGWNQVLSDDEVEIAVQAIGACVGSAVGFVGIVTNTGSSCSLFTAGALVWGIVAGQTCQTHIRVPQSQCQLLRTPSLINNAALWSITLGVAYGALVSVAQVQAGQLLLVQAAGSAVGQCAIQLAHLRSVVVFATVSSEEDRLMVEGLGVNPSHVLEDDDPDLETAISGLTHGKGLDIIMTQSSTPSLLQSLWSCIAASGILVDVGFEGVDHDKLQLPLAPFRRGARYSAFDMGRLLRDDPSLVAQIQEGISQLKLHEGFQTPQSTTTWKAAEAAAAFAWAERHTGSAAVVLFGSEDKIPVTHAVANPFKLDANATFLLVGGTGGLGANLAVFLAQHGAHHLAVVSRSGPKSITADSFTNELAALGVKVRLYTADVSDEAAMRNVLLKCAAEMPSIRGVLQCAAVLDDAIYDNMTHHQWENAIRPKLHGSWLLHKLLPHNLQFFVMLSSIAGVVGNRSQANYAAGNTYQDALAHYRRSQGLPAVSVDLGLMLGIGLIAERGGATNLKKWEAVGITEREFHRLMMAAITGSWSGHVLPAQVICGLPTGGILQSQGLERPFYFDDPRFANLRKKGLLSIGEQQQNTAEPLSSMLGKAESMHDAIEIATTGLSQRLAAELKTDIANIDSTRPLHSYGVDSLLAVEIRNWIVINLQAELSLFDILGGGSIQALAKRIAAISKAVPDTVQ